MMTQVNIHEAKTRLSELLELVQNGEEVIIAKSGKPIARLTEMPASKSIVFGLVPDLRTPDDFDAPLPEETRKLFEGQS
jgi:prevent-host-death family protein